MSSNDAPTDAYLELLKGCLTGSIYDESSWRIEDGFRSGRSGLWYQLRRSFFRWMRSRGLLMVRAVPFDSARREEGRDWPLFGYSMIGRKRIDNLEQVLRSVVTDGIPGDIVETGVWRGGAMIFAKAVLRQLGETNRTIWLADSFQGLPKPTHAADKVHKSHDLADCDFLKVSIDQVQANFERFGLLDERVKFLKGWFCDTLPTAPIDRIAVLRFDGDLYESTRDVLTTLYRKVVPGGYVIIDDYSWSGCREAVQEFRQQHQIDAELKMIDFTGAYWRVPYAASSSQRRAA